MSRRLAVISDEGLITRPANGHDRRRDRTRGALAAAARALIAEQGLTGLQTTEITRRAGVSPGSFYNHFSSKDELIEAVIADALASLTIAMTTKRAPEQDPAEIISDSMRRFIGMVDDDPELARLVVQLDRADALMAAVVYPEGRRALQDGIDRGRFTDIDIETTLISVLGGALALMRAMLAGMIGTDAAPRFTESTLRGFGIPSDDAHTLVDRPLTPLADQI
jgi:AcrR family transcriptional regulator